MDDSVRLTIIIVMIDSFRIMANRKCPRFRFSHRFACGQVASQVKDEKRTSTCSRLRWSVASYLFWILAGSIGNVDITLRNVAFITISFQKSKDNFFNRLIKYSLECWCFEAKEEFQAGALNQASKEFFEFEQKRGWN